MAKIGSRAAMERKARPLVATAGTPRLAGEIRVIPDPVRGSAWIAAQLREAIVEGGYGHGEKLPAERQLAGAFGASRTTVRSALDQLEAERLVSRRIGSGTFVNFVAPGDAKEVAELTYPLELIEVRIGVEPHMTRLAVINATARDIDRLAEAVAEIPARCGDPEGFTAWDEQFHLLIAECTRNPLMVSLYRQINDVRGHAQWHAMKDQVLTPERIAEYNQQHRALYEMIRSRDVEGAVALITNHLHFARRQLLGADSR